MWCWRYTITSELAVSADRLLDVFWSKIYISNWCGVSVSAAASRCE